MSAGDMSTNPGLPTPGHAAYDELTVGFALDALEPGEEELLLAHLPDCGRCQDALIAHQEVAASLAYALPLEAMPPMSPELAECVRSKPRQLPVDPFAAAEAAGRAALPRSRRAASSPPLVGPPRRSIVGRQARRVLVGAGALGIIAAVGLSGYDVHLRSSPTHPTAPSAQAALTAITERGVTIAHLSGSRSSGTAVVAPDGHAYLVASGLTSTRSSTSYVVWNLDGAEPTPLKGFVSSGAGTAQVVDLGVATSTAPQKYAVTLEKTPVTAALPKAPSPDYVLTEDAHSA